MSEERFTQTALKISGVMQREGLKEFTAKSVPSI